MFTHTAAYYDRIYAFKDYAGEAARLVEIIDAANPGARTLLDVGSGTGAHALHLAERFEVEGVDLQPELVDIATEKVPKASFRVADMRTMDLGRTYDAIVCLFGVIAYARELDAVTEALRRMEAHLAPGGVVVVEPFITPENWRPAGCHLSVVDDDDLKVCRMNASGRVGDLAIIHFHYLIGTAEGVRHEEEEHVLGLFSVDQMLGAFTAAGLAPRHELPGLDGRGLYVATRG